MDGDNLIQDNLAKENATLRYKLKEAQLMIHAMVGSCGTIRVSHRMMVDPPKVINRTEDPVTMAVVFTVG